ncbi:MAG TPA: hypothetical protein VMT37_13495 [Solirubrobacterales bacterium]|nr:hypothetical protein [Solirubrobacterales bacterium]
MKVGATAIVALIALIFAASASAFEDPPVKHGVEAEHIQATTDLLNELSPRKAEGFEPSYLSEELFEEATEAGAALSPVVTSELRNESSSLIKKVGLWAWDYAPAITVGAGGFWAGWEIGSFVYGEFFEESEAGGSGGTLSYPADRWRVVPPGYGMLSDNSGTVKSPGWGLEGYNHEEGSVGVETDTGGCEHVLYGDGTRLLNGWLGAAYCGIGAYRQYVLWRPLAPIRCTLFTCPGIEPVPYEGKGQPTLPSSKQLEERTQEELESGAYPEVNRLLNFQDDPENFPDPRITRTREDHRCDRSPGPTYENPDRNLGPEPFAKKEEAEYNVTARPEGFKSTPVFLRWGTTFWEPSRKKFKEEERTPYMDLWGGWGYRHIVAKHGWSELDRAETELALELDLTPLEESSGKWKYEEFDPIGGVGGVECVRAVIVKFETKEGDPAPLGIVSSYNIAVP